MRKYVCQQKMRDGTLVDYRIFPSRQKAIDSVPTFFCTSDGVRDVIWKKKNKITFVTVEGFRGYCEIKKI
mgnify:CR=1 FL=1